MASLQSRRVAVSVVGFLRNQITETNSATSTSFEDCLDGAIQFLTSAFGLDQSFITSVTLPGSLTEIFEAGCKQLTMEKSGERYGGLSFAKPRPVRAPVSEDDKANAEMLKDDGNQLMSEERFSEASEAYSRALELDPNNAVIYYNRAAAYYRLGEYCSVVRDCNSALHLNHKYAKAFSLKAIALFSLQRYREAYEYFAEASRLEPANETYTANLRQAYAKLSFEIGAAKASAVEHDFQTRGYAQPTSNKRFLFCTSAETKL
jgi:tetratricopeptide (TPR) repeat protein